MSYPDLPRWLPVSQGRFQEAASRSSVFQTALLGFLGGASRSFPGALLETNVFCML